MVANGLTRLGAERLGRQKGDLRVAFSFGGDRLNSIRGGRGLGDGLYVQAVARYLLNRDKRPLEVCCDYPDIFRRHGDRVKVSPFRRTNISILAHYSLRKCLLGSDQFEDVCIQAGVPRNIELRLDWTLTDAALAERLKSHGKPIVCVQLPRAPMGRTDGFGAELLPDCRKIQVAIDALKGRALIVQVGSGKPLFRFTGIDLDLAGETTVCELLDVASVADAFLAYPSFVIPLAESFDKPSLLVWSSRGLRSGPRYVQQIRPEKILHKPSSSWVIDNYPDEKIAEAANALLR